MRGCDNLPHTVVVVNYERIDVWQLQWRSFSENAQVLRCRKGSNSQVNRKILIDVIGVLLIALVVVVGYKLSPMLLPKADVTVQPDPACNLHLQSCSVALPGGGKAELSSSVQPIPMVKPFNIQVVLNGVEASRVEVDFTGLDMNMGLNRPVLKDQGGGRFVAEATLPVCITGDMDWQATVLIETGSQRIAIPYRFSGNAHQHG